MKKINPNQLIINTSKSLRYLSLVLIALLFSKIIWWIINPLGYTQIDNPALRSEKSQEFAQAIINRAAFGVYVEEHAAVPTINIKVIGVYAAGPNNSVAFLQVDDKHTIASIGDKVLEGTIKSILPTGIIITTNNQDVNINIGGSNSMSNTLPTAQAHIDNSSTSQSPYNNNSQAADSSNHNKNNDTPPPQNQTNDSNNLQANGGSSNASTNPNGNNPDDSLISKRQKMIQEFQQQNANNQN